MAQVATTIRLDSELKTRFDNLCEEFGMTLNTAVNIFVKTVVRTRSIPFKIELDNPNETGMRAFEALQRQAQVAGLSEMTLDDINAEIAEARASIK